MSVPVVIEFLAETDDMLAQTKGVESGVQDVVGATKASVDAVEQLVNEAAAQMRAAAQGAGEAFRTEAAGIAERFKAVEESVKGVIQSIQSTVETVSGAITPVVNQVRDAYEGLKGQIEDTSKKAALGFTALGAGTLLAGGAALEAGQKYEDLQARLRGLTGDVAVANELFREAVDFAATTPFSVEQLVDATAQLKAFGQAGSENLKLVAEIAAASGQPVQDTALRVGKALAGISEGFQGLRDTSGITAERLAKYGAVMNSVGGVSVQGAEQIAKARKALQELGRVEFAGNIERQSQTYTGSLSNAGDAVTNFKATIGEQLIPVATVAIRVFSGLVSGATSVAQFLGPVIPIMGGLALVVSGVGVAVAAAASVFAGLIARAIVLNTVIAGANVALGFFGLSMGGLATSVRALAFSNVTLAGSFTAVQAGATAAIARLVAFRAAAASAVASMTLLSPLGIGAIAVGLIAVNEGLKLMERNAKAAGDEIAVSSAAFQGAAQGFRETSLLFKEISGVDLTFGATVRENAAEAVKALEGLTDLEIAGKLAKAGESLESLNSKLIENQAASDKAKSEIFRLTEALEAAKKAAVPNAKTGIVSPESLAMVAQLEGDLKAASAALQKLGSDSAGLRVLVDAVSRISPALDQATKDATRLDGFMKFANGLESLDQIQAAIGEVDNAINDSSRNMLQAFGTLDKFELGKLLADPDIAGNEKAVKAIEAYLGLLNDREKLQDKVAKGAEDAAKKVEEASKKEIKDYENVTARKKALGELTLQQERSRIEGQLALVEEGTEAETKLLEQLASKDKEILEKREQLAQNALTKRVNQIEESIANVSKASGATAAQTSSALRDAIAEMETFRNTQKDMFAGAPEAAEAYRVKVVDLKRELASSEAEELSEKFKELKKDLEQGIDSNGTTAQQLVDVGAAIVTLKAAMASKTVEQSGAEDYLADLEEKKLGLMREQTAEKLKQVDEIAALQAQALDQEIEILQARLAAGENVERQLGEATKARLQLQADNIQAAMEREIAGGADRVLAEQKAALQLDALYKKEALSKFQSAKKADSDIEQLGRRRGRGQGSGSSAVGAFQPSFSPGGAFGTSPFSQSPIGVSVNATAIPAFAEDFGRRIKREAPRAPSFDNFVRQTRQDGGLQRPGAGSFSSLAGSNKLVSNQTTIRVEGRPADADDQALAAAAERVRQNEEKRRRRGQLNGEEGARKSGSPIGYGLGAR